MNARTTRMLSLCIVVISALTATLSAAELPTVEDVLSVYRANREKLSTLHVQMKQTHEWTEAHRTFHAYQARDAAKKLELIETAIKANPGKPLVASPDLRLTNQQIVDNSRNTLEIERRDAVASQQTEHFEFFLDGDNHQVRYPIALGPQDLQEHVEFPAVPVTPASLLKEYVKFRIYSRLSGRTPAAEIWTGKPRPVSTPQVLLTSQQIWQTGHRSFPPLSGKLNPAWNVQHPIDRFFSANAGRYRVADAVTREGRELTVVDAAIPTELKEYAFDANGNPGKERTVTHFFRAWLDLERGAIPVTLHYWRGHDDRDIDWYSKFDPPKVVTTKKFLRLADDAWYPAVTVEEISSRDPDAPEPTAEEWGEIRAGKRKLKKAVYERLTWDCSLVEPNFKHDDSFFDLKFPGGVTFFDIDANKIVGALELKPSLKPGQPAPPLQLARWLDGKERSLEDFRGQVVFLDFWGLWCSACRGSVPQLNLLKEKYQDRPVVFISIHTAERDQEKLAERIKTYTQKEGWQFLAAIDRGTMTENSRTANEYGIRGFPGMVVIGADGVVRFNTDIPPEGMEDIQGQSELTAEQEARYTAYMKKQFEAAGVEWFEDDAEISPEERKRRGERVFLFQMSGPIDAALQAAGLTKQ